MNTGRFILACVIFTFAVAEEGYLTTLAGGTRGYQEGRGRDAQFYAPAGIVHSRNGSSLYIADYGNSMLREYVMSSGQVLHLAGCPFGCHGYADGIGPFARFNRPKGLALHPHLDYILITDYINQRIRQYNLSTGEVTTVAGSGSSSVRDGYGTSASIYSPNTIAIDPTGTFALVTSVDGRRLCRLDLLTRALIAVAGNGAYGYQLGSGPFMIMKNPYGVAISNNGRFALFTDAGSVIYSLDLVTNVVTHLCTAAAAVQSITISKDSSTAYISEFNNHKIVRIDIASRSLHHVVGTGIVGSDDGPAESARLNRPMSITLSNDESRLFISEFYDNAIRSFEFTGLPVTPSPTISPYDSTGRVYSLAGSTYSGNNDDTGPFATFNYPHKVLLTPGGVYGIVCDTMNHVIRKIVVATQAVSRLAGSGIAGFANGVGVLANFNQPTHIALHPSGLYVLITDRNNHRIRLLNLTTDEVSTMAGSGSVGSVDAVGLFASFHFPAGIAIDPSGTFVLVSDSGSHLLRMIEVITRAVTTIAGSGQAGFAEGYGSHASFNSPWGVAISSKSNVAWVADAGNNMIRIVNLSSKHVSNFCGWLYSGRSDGDCEVARFSSPYDIAINPDDTSAVIADRDNNMIRLLNLDDRKVITLAGNDEVGSADGPSRTATLNKPSGIAIWNNFAYFADRDNHKLRYANIFTLAIPTSHPTRRPTSPPTVTHSPTRQPTMSPTRPATFNSTFTVAGSGGASTIDGTRFSATFNHPMSLATLPDGQHVLVSDRGAHILRVVNVHSGKVTSVAGTISGYADGVSTVARFSCPEGIAVYEASGVALVCDACNNRIRLVHLSNYSVFTIAGSGDAVSRDGVGTEAAFNSPQGIAIHPSGVYCLITDAKGHRIRRYNFFTRSVTTLAGSGSAGDTDDQGIYASFDTPGGIAISPNGLFALFAATKNNGIKMISLTTLLVSTYCGSKVAGLQNGQCSQAQFNEPFDVTISEDSEHVYVADTLNNVIRDINVVTMVVRVLSGTSIAGNRDDFSVLAEHFAPKGIAMNGTCVFIADSSNNRLRGVDISPPPPTLSPTALPSAVPSSVPTTKPSSTPTFIPSATPTVTPTSSHPTLMPTAPSSIPTSMPSNIPTSTPSIAPTHLPTCAPTWRPTCDPTTAPTSIPSSKPTFVPSSMPTASPTSIPSSKPTVVPSSMPTASPTSIPSSKPTVVPSLLPTASPTSIPSSKPTVVPSSMPTLAPFVFPSPFPSKLPSPTPSPSLRSTVFPTLSPTTYMPPHLTPTRHPSVFPSPSPSLPQVLYNVSLFAGRRGSGADDGVGDFASFAHPTGIIVAVDNSYVFVMDTLNHIIRRVMIATRDVTTFAGSGGVPGFRDDIGEMALFSYPTDGAMHPSGVYMLITDRGNRMIRKVSVYFREVAVFVGSGENAERDGVGSDAAFVRPFGIAISPDGRFGLVSDIGSAGLRTINLDTKAVTTIHSSQFISPFGVSFTSSGQTALIVDHGSHAILMLNVTTRAVSVFCGVQGVPGNADGPCEMAKLRNPSSVRVSADSTRAIITDMGNHEIRLIDMSSKTLVTLAGTGEFGYRNGYGDQAQFTFPGYAVSVGETIVVSDQGNEVIRIMRKVATSGDGDNGLDEDATGSKLRGNIAMMMTWSIILGCVVLILLIVVGLLLACRYKQKKKLPTEEESAEITTAVASVVETDGLNHKYV